MRKIISLFQRNYDGDRLVRNEVVPGAEWVIAGEGRATLKLDGTCCLVKCGILWKRYEVKPGGKVPVGFVAANDVDDATGKQHGWLPVGAGPDDKWHREAWDDVDPSLIPEYEGRTFELLGPKVQGNAEGKYIANMGCAGHVLVPHGIYTITNCPRDFDGLKAYFEANDIEGVVWWHPDGRMVKIKGKDFGIKRKGKS